MHPDALFYVFGQGVHLYGICIAIGILACLLIFYKYTTTQKLNPDVQDFVYFVAIAAIALGFLGAKLFQAFYDYIETGVFNFAGAGLTVMGGIIGGVVAFVAVYFGVGHFLFKKKGYIHVSQFNEILRVAPICITAAHGFGRLGCLFAGCCHGAYLGKEYVFGGILMGSGYYVPIQLYEAIFLFALCAVLSVLYFKRFNLIASVYLIAYAIWRFVIEFFRGDDRGMADGAILSPSQWQSFVFLGVGILIAVFYLVIKKYPLFLEKISKDEGKEKAKKAVKN